MRTFQFSDAKSHKFWSIDVQGKAFTVTYGKVGTAGQTQTKTFPTADKAAAEAAKLVAEKTKKGYRETGETAAPAGPTADAAALEAGILDHPDELVRWQVYSDYLIEQGDPRGEFMRVQLALEDESLSAPERKKLKAEEKKLLAAHETDWLGPLAAFTVDGEKTDQYVGAKKQKLPPVLHAFARGWLSRVEFLDLTVGQARALAATTDARLLRELVVGTVASELPEGQKDQYTDSFYAPGPDVPEGIDAYDQPGLHALCRCPHLGAVVSFRLGIEGDQCHTSGDLAHSLIKQMPRVERIELYAHRVDANKLFPLPMPRLKSFTMDHSNRYPLEKLAENPTLTKLETFTCHPHALEPEDDEVRAYIRTKQLKAVCRSKHLTSLTHLQLRLTDFGDDGVEEIIETGLLKRLRVLDLQGGCITDEGAELLVACPELKNLRTLNLNGNALTRTGIDALKATGVNVIAQYQHTYTSSRDDDEPAEYLFEGDIE